MFEEVREGNIAAACRRHGTNHSDYYWWREELFKGAKEVFNPLEERRIQSRKG